MPVNMINNIKIHAARHQQHNHQHLPRQESLSDPLPIPSLSGFHSGALATSDPAETATGLLLPSAVPTSPSSGDNGAALPFVPGQSAVMITVSPSSSSTTAPSSSPTGPSNNDKANAPSNSGSGNSGLPIGAVVGICVGVFILLSCLLLLLIYWMRKRNKKMERKYAAARASGKDAGSGDNAGGKRGFSQLPDDDAAIIAGGNIALREKKTETPPPHRPSPPSYGVISTSSSDVNHGNQYRNYNNQKSSLKPIPTLSPIQISVSEAKTSYLVERSPMSSNGHSPSASVMPLHSGGMPVYTFAPGSEETHANSEFAYTVNSDDMVTLPDAVHFDSRRRSPTASSSKTYAPNLNANTNLSGSTSSLAKQKSHKHNYGGSLGLAHAFHDRLSLYTNEEDNSMESELDGSFLSLSRSGEEEGEEFGYGYGIGKKVKMTPEAKATPPVLALSDLEEKEVGTPPVTPGYLMLERERRGQLNPFEDPSQPSTLSPLSPSLAAATLHPLTLTKKIPLSMPTTPMTASTIHSTATAASASTVTHSNSRMETLLAALNIPLSPSDGYEDDEGGHDAGMVPLKSSDPSAFEIGHSDVGTFPMPPFRKA